MSSIVGTTTTIQKYLTKSDVKLTVNPNTPEERSIILPKDRKYTIPAYQRELRWNSDNVNVLLSDLINGPRFLGNVILSLGPNSRFEIIDGQQRTTILQMIVACIKSKFGEEIEVLDCCEIENESFPGLSKLIAVGFDESFIDSVELAEIKEQDNYSQLERFKDLWQMMCKSQIICDRYQASSLINNIKSSDINIIASQSSMESESIRYFLDVNLKGVRLDKEDIFKGYLFQLSSKKEIKKLWQEIKKLSIEFNELKDGRDNKRYPLMKIYEHFFFCDLYLPKSNGQDFSDVSFGEDFCLSRTTNIQGKTFYEGTHIIEVIQKAQYLCESLKRIKTALKYMIDIISSSGPSDSFKNLFKCSEKVDSKDVENTHCILKKILLDKETIPKVLALKYIISFFDGKTHIKKDYKSIYSVFAAATFFAVFANKKESGTFYSFVKYNDWIDSINKWLDGYVHSHELTRGKLLAAYSFSVGEDDSIDGQVRSKSLAAVFNFIRIRREHDKYVLSVNNCKQLNAFLTNNTEYSIEHFIIAENGTLEIKTDKFDFNYTYPPSTKKYRNSLFNYIFILDTLNNNLGNSCIHKKTSEINKQIDKVTCKYSKMYIDLLESGNFFADYPSPSEIDKCNSEEDARKKLNQYFLKGFPDEFLQFSSALIKTLGF